MEREELQDSLEEKLDEIKRLNREYMQEKLGETVESQLGKDLSEKELVQQRVQLLKDIDIPEEYREMEKLDGNLAYSLQLVKGRPELEEEHKFADNPYKETPDKEKLEKLHRKLEELDSLDTRSEKTRKELKNILDNFENNRRQN